MRLVLDYRPALRARSGVGEYVHQVARALAGCPEDAVTLFTSSWKDRPPADVAAVCANARVVDCRVPVSVLNATWHWLEWPPIEWLAHDDFDVAFSPHPLLLPARRAAQIVMIHDLDFLDHPERTQREIRRDYSRLAGAHARRAARVIVPSRHTGEAVAARLDVPARHVVVCPPGAPEWRGPIRRFARDGYVLFMGTLEPRKNVGALLAAYARLVARRDRLPTLVLAGSAGPAAAAWLNAIAEPPLSGRVEHIGYVAETDRQRVYEGARALVLPSHDEGFGMPALEAMSLGIPTIVSRRGALPDLVGDAGMLVEPDDVESIAAALEQVLSNDALADSLSARGILRAQPFRWANTACLLREAFYAAFEERRPTRQPAGSPRF
jgi:glycosyltransferase involved in cell wall biosynthesis